MMRQEFEELAGIHVGSLFYDEMLEPMYNALPEFVYKQDFARFIDARKAQLIFYKEMISKGAVGTLKNSTVMRLLSDLEYLEVLDKALSDHFFYYDTDSAKHFLNSRFGKEVTASFKGGYTHAEPMKESCRMNPFTPEVILTNRNRRTHEHIQHRARKSKL